MYYICKKREDSDGVKYGIMDTKDGVIEYYSPSNIIKVKKVRQLDIEGVYLDVATNKWHIKVVSPTGFKEVEGSESVTDNDYSATDFVVPSIGQPYEANMYRESGSTIICDLPSDFYRESGILLDKCLEPFRRVLDDWAYTLTGLSTADKYLDALDELDCIGFKRLPIKDTKNYYLQITSNPVGINDKLEFRRIRVSITDYDGNPMYVYNEVATKEVIINGVEKQNMVWWLSNNLKVLNDVTKQTKFYFNSPIILDFAQTAKKACEVLLGGELNHKLLRREMITCWLTNPRIGLFEYDVKNDRILRSDEVLLAESGNWKLTILGAVNTTCYTYLQFDAKTNTYILCNSKNYDYSKLIKSMRRVTPFADYLNSHKGILCRGSKEDIFNYLDGLRSTK